MSFACGLAKRGVVFGVTLAAIQTSQTAVAAARRKR